MESEKKFKGFTKQSIEFLFELGFNNNKTWFEEHRDTYVEHVLTPLRQLSADLHDFMYDIDSNMELRPTKIVSRINRDIRFSKNKLPYRTNMWISFKRASVDKNNIPTFYFEISPMSYSYGMGFYAANKEAMDRFRQKILNQTNEFKEAIAFYYKQNVFTLSGEQYKRQLKADIEPELNEWYQRKNLYFFCTKSIDETVMSSALVDVLINDLNILKDFYHYLFQFK